MDKSYYKLIFQSYTPADALTTKIENFYFEGI